MIISVILTILKILGIIILCIVGILLFLILSILFIPIRYSFYIEYHDKLQAKARLSWFLHILSFSFAYNEDGPIYKIKFLGIPISKLFHKSQRDVSKSHNSKKEKKTIPSEEANNTEIVCEKPTEPIANSKIPDKSINSDFSESRRRKKSKIAVLIDKIKSRILSLIQTGKNFWNNVSYYKDLLEDNETKEAFAACKYRLGKLIHHIIPVKFQFHVTYGLEDPSVTAKILAIYSMFYAYIGDYVFLHPDFEKQEIYILTKGKGRITSSVLGYHILRVYFDRNCKNFINKLKKKENLDE